MDGLATLESGRLPVKADLDEAARRRLSALIRYQAHKAAQRCGFGWSPQPDAPDTYSELMAAYENSVETKAPLPISNLYCDLVIYDTPDTNIAFRFWHDTTHAQSGLTFDLVDELELAIYHLDVLKHEGFSPRSTEYRLLHADLVGQVFLLALTKEFPPDQRSFVQKCLDHGFDTGLLLEALALPKRGTE